MSSPLGRPNLEVRLHGVFGTFQLRADFKSFGLATAVFGHSGAGKTSLIHMLAGLKTPHTGFIRVGDTVVFDSDEHINMPVEERRVGMVFQDSRLFPHLSVERNLTYSNWAGGRKPKLKFDDVVGLLSLEGFLNRKPANLSGGEQQRVAIGRALLSDPRMLLLDEPLASLDNARKQDILPFIERVAQESHIPICYVSHSMDEVARIADDLVVLSRGKTIAYGPLSDILTRVDLGGATGRHEAGALVPAKVSRHDDITGLTELMLQTDPPLAFEITRSELPEASDVRLRIRARDVSLAVSPISGLSIRNQLPAQIETVQLDDKGYAEVVLRLGEAGTGPRLRSRITAASAMDLKLEIGASIYALIKSIAIERRLLQPVGEASIPLPKLPLSTRVDEPVLDPEPVISVVDESPQITRDAEITPAHKSEEPVEISALPVDQDLKSATGPLEKSSDPVDALPPPSSRGAEEQTDQAVVSLQDPGTQSDEDVKGSILKSEKPEPPNPFLMDAPPRK